MYKKLPVYLKIENSSANKMQSDIKKRGILCLECLECGYSTVIKKGNSMQCQWCGNSYASLNTKK